MPYPFLSDEWIAEAHKIRAEFRGKTQPIAHTVKMNLVVTEVPFGDGHTTLDAHMDTSSGELELDLGHMDEQDLKVTVDYATAKSILVDGNAQAGMQAFMAGKVRVEGDIAKLMALQGARPTRPTRRSPTVCERSPSSGRPARWFRHRPVHKWPGRAPRPGDDTTHDGGRRRCSPTPAPDPGDARRDRAGARPVRSRGTVSAVDSRG